jgi:hypothetical protein
LRGGFWREWAATDWALFDLLLELQMICAIMPKSISLSEKPLFSRHLSVEPVSMVPFIIRFVVIALICYVVWCVIRPRYAVRIVIDDQGIKYHHGLPAAHEREVLEFLQEQLTLERELTICVNRQPGGYLRISFKGQIPPGTRQQIRNYLNSVM